MKVRAARARADERWCGARPRLTGVATVDGSSSSLARVGTAVVVVEAAYVAVPRKATGGVVKAAVDDTRRAVTTKEVHFILANVR
jgi:hypothetical protein